MIIYFSSPMIFVNILADEFARIFEATIVILFITLWSNPMIVYCVDVLFSAYLSSPSQYVYMMT